MSASFRSLALVLLAGIPACTVTAASIQVGFSPDGANVETGSYNFSSAANKSNSENAILIQNVPELAQQYLQHWQSRWQAGRDWKSTY
ncbi:hypothetical protein C5I50_004208 [Salmonella enterica subsp. enterica serovar Thompson]|nr:hypothetical protein [Salmonella enterica subsp. enterica serovar Thompson]